jgi:hypothetical protein
LLLGRFLSGNVPTQQNHMVYSALIVLDWYSPQFEIFGGRSVFFDHLHGGFQLAGLTRQEDWTGKAVVPAWHMGVEERLITVPANNVSRMSAQGASQSLIYRSNNEVIIEREYFVINSVD